MKKVVIYESKIIHIQKKNVCKSKAYLHKIQKNLMQKKKDYVQLKHKRKKAIKLPKFTRDITKQISKTVGMSTYQLFILYI